MRDETIVKITAILSLAFISVVALHYGVDHTLHLSIGAIIGGIAGYSFGRERGVKR